MVDTNGLMTLIVTHQTKQVTFVQPGHFGVDGDMNSWMIERFQVDSFNYNLRYEKNDQIFKFQYTKSNSKY